MRNFGCEILFLAVSLVVHVCQSFNVFKGHHHQPSPSIRYNDNGVRFMSQWNFEAIDIQPNSTLRRVDEFYRQHFSGRKRVAPAAARPGDMQCNLLSRDENLTMVATLRVIPKMDSWAFIRGLCVDKNERRQGIALNLMSRVFSKLREDRFRGLYCFAEPTLAPLYKKAGFSEVPNVSSDMTTPIFIRQQLLSMNKRLKRKNQSLALFTQTLYQPNISNTTANATANATSSPQVVLLQHGNELKRTTATGPLLYDIDNLDMSNLTWNGRADNEEITLQLQNLQNPVLLWTGGASKLRRDFEKVDPTFIVLDGTWQEAKSIFRKLPYLQSLPRLTLEPAANTSYYLRKDFSGWQEKFSRGGEGDKTQLLCTAEVVAELMESLGHDNQSGFLIRKRLQRFQKEYAVANATSRQQLGRTSRVQ